VCGCCRPNGKNYYSNRRQRAPGFCPGFKVQYDISNHPKLRAWCVSWNLPPESNALGLVPVVDALNLSLDTVPQSS
jgi:hypothetical protein